jgi:hypothetical protein
VQQGQKAVRDALTDQIGRLTSMYEEIGRLEATGLDLAAATIDGSSAWLKQSVSAAENMRASARQAVKETATMAAKPMAPFAESLGAFKRVAEESAARMAAYGEEVARLEREGSGRLNEAFDEYTRLLKESLRYGSQMAAEWRKLTVEAAKRTAESITPTV